VFVAVEQRSLQAIVMHVIGFVKGANSVWVYSSEVSPSIPSGEKKHWCVVKLVEVRLAGLQKSSWSQPTKSRAGNVLEVGGLGPTHGGGARLVLHGKPTTSIYIYQQRV
jgi:hypothetical protein